MYITLHRPRKYSRTVEKKVQSYYYTEYSRRFPKFSGYCEEQKRIQDLLEITTYSFFIFSISFSEVLDTEVVPAHVWIGLGALGFDTSEWKSKFCEYIK